MPIKIVQVDNPLTQSAWMVGIDGVMSPVYVQHPNGSDYRRPHDIWTNVWLPIINGSTSVQDAVKVGVGANITDVGDMTRFQYLEYARCLPLPGTPTTQTDTIAQ